MDYLPFNEKYLDWPTISSLILKDNKLQKGIITLHSPMGSNKTGIIKNISDLAKSQGLGVLSISPRITLAKKIADDLELNFYNDKFNNFPLNYYSVVINSIRKKLTEYQINTKFFKNHIVILDEAVQMLFHLNSKIVKKFEAITILDAIIKNAHTIIISDAHLNQESFSIYACMRNISYDIIKGQAITDNSIANIIYDPVFPQNLLNYNNNFYINKTDNSYYLKNNTDEHNRNFIELDYKYALISVYEHSINGGKSYISCDSKKEAEMIKGFLEAYVNKHFAPTEKMPYPPNIILCSSDNSKSEFIRNLLTNLIDIDIFITTPVVSTGLSFNNSIKTIIKYDSISEKYIKEDLKIFDRIYGFFKGNTIHYTDQLQMLFRIRNIKDIYISFANSIDYIDTKKLNQYYTDDELRNDFNSSSRITDILLGKINSNLNFGSRHQYKCNPNNISMLEYVRLYEHLDVNSNIDHINYELPNNLSIFLMQKFYISEMAKHFSYPHYWTRRFIIQQGHSLIIDGDANRLNDKNLTYVYNDNQLQYLKNAHKNIIDKNYFQQICPFNLSDNLANYQEAWFLYYQEMFKYRPLLQIDISEINIEDINFNNPKDIEKYKAYILQNIKFEKNSAIEIAEFNYLLNSQNIHKCEQVIIYINYLNQNNYLNALQSTNLSIFDQKCKLFIEMINLLHNQFPNGWDSNLLTNNQELVQFIAYNYDFIKKLFNRTMIPGKEIYLVHKIIELGIQLPKQKNYYKLKCKRYIFKTDNQFINIEKIINNWNNLHLDRCCLLLNDYIKHNFTQY